MNIMVIGAYGKAGRLIIKEAFKRGHKVVGVAPRRHRGFDFNNIMLKDMMALTRQDVDGMDAVVDAVGAWTPKTMKAHYQGLLHVVQLVNGTDTRYIKIGGANTLFINAEHTQTLQLLPKYYPRYMRDVCNAHQQGFDTLKTFAAVNPDLRWTYVTPAYKFAPDGPYTGMYQVKGEEFTPAKDNDPDNGHNDYISYADYAKGIVDLIEQGSYIRQRITLIGGDMPDKRLVY